MTSMLLFVVTSVRLIHLQLLLGALDLSNKLAEDVAALGQIVDLLGSETALLEQVVESLGLFLDVARVLGELIEDLDVVLSVGILDVLRSSQNLLLDGLESAAASVLGNEGVKSGNGTSSDVETTTDSTVSTGLLVEVLDKSILGTTTLVGDRLSRTLGEELDGRVTLDALLLGSSLCVFSFSVNLGDEDCRFVGVVVGELFPDGSKGLAVCKEVSILALLRERHSLLTSTPRGSEGNNDILVTANLGLEGLVVQHLNIAGDGGLLLLLEASFLGDEGRQALEVSAAVVVHRSVALSIEPLEGREALNTESTAELLVSISVNLSDGDLVLCEFERRSQLLVDRGKILAVTAPWSEELDQSRLSRLENDVVEVLGDEVDDGRSGRSANQGERSNQSESHVCDLMLVLSNS